MRWTAANALPSLILPVSDCRPTGHEDKQMILDSPEVHDLTDPRRELGPLARDPLFIELAASRAFQRLADIRFLGGIDYLLIRSPNGAPQNRRYTRYQHSLGVARLAYLYSAAKGLSEKDTRLAYTAALLHDVGHAPLSHTLEGVFKKAFGIDHHKAGAAIILGQSPFGSEIATTLDSHGINPEVVIDVAAGKTDWFDGFFAGPINFDTIEGILRSLFYLWPRASLPRPEEVMTAALRRETREDEQLVDAFWMLKDHAYRFIIRSEFGVAADHLCAEAFKQDAEHVTADDYFLTERQLFRKSAKLKALLTTGQGVSAIQEISEPLAYSARRFLIDEDVDFFGRDDQRRYKQTKESRLINPSHTDIPPLRTPLPFLGSLHERDIRKDKGEGRRSAQ